MVNGLLFDEKDLIPWLQEWQDMPEFSHDDLAPRYQVIINFACEQDVKDFSELIDQSVTANKGRQLKSVWFPEQEIGRMVNKRYVSL